MFKNKYNYQSPTILSVRIGFSADHSHECYGCPICGKFGHGVIEICEECGKSWTDDIDMGVMECYPYCEMKWIDDFCALHGGGWCDSHARLIKYRDSDDLTVIKGLCMDCFKRIYSKYHNYCTKCSAFVIKTEDGKCPFCETITLKDAPDKWKHYKATHDPLPDDPPIDFEW